MLNVANKIYEIELKLMKCGSTVKANNELIAKRIRKRHWHIRLQSVCKGSQHETLRIIDSNMGKYTYVVKILDDLKKLVTDRAAKLKSNKKASRNLLFQASVIDGYINDSRLKQWNLSWLNAQVKGWQCNTL